MFNLKDNVLRIEEDPINDADVFASLCAQLFDSPSMELTVWVGPHVSSLHSVYVGVLIAAAARAQEEGRRFSIVCSTGLDRMLSMCGGSCLKTEIAIEEGDENET